MSQDAIINRRRCHPQDRKFHKTDYHKTQYLIQEVVVVRKIENPQGKNTDMCINNSVS